MFAVTEYDRKITNVLTYILQPSVKRRWVAAVYTPSVGNGCSRTIRPWRVFSHEFGTITIRVLATPALHAKNVYGSKHGRNLCLAVPERCYNPKNPQQNAVFQKRALREPSEVKFRIRRNRRGKKARRMRMRLVMFIVENARPPGQTAPLIAASILGFLYAWRQMFTRVRRGIVSVWYPLHTRTRLAHACTWQNHGTQPCPHADLKEPHAYFWSRGAWNVIHGSFTCASRLNLQFSVTLSMVFFRV